MAALSVQSLMSGKSRGVSSCVLRAWRSDLVGGHAAGQHDDFRLEFAPRRLQRLLTRVSTAVRWKLAAKSAFWSSVKALWQLRRRESKIFAGQLLGRPAERLF